MLDLSKLHEFNEALVYGFEPEASPASIVYGPGLVNTIIPNTDQREDMYRAYMHAQEVILPRFRASIDTLTAEELLTWIKALHADMGRTILALFHKKSGVYVDQQVCRWHGGNEINDHLINYLSNLHQCKTDESLARLVAKERNIDYQDMLAFIKVVVKIGNDDSIELSLEERAHVESVLPLERSGSRALYRLTNAFHSNRLSQEEREIVNKIVLVCIPPKEVPVAMDAFAALTVERFKHCPKDDIKALSNFLAELFYEFTDIHPFGNANGRTATAVINLVLRALNYPSILLRHPGDKESESSEYSQAIKHISRTREPLQQLIEKRIHDARVSPFRDEVKKAEVVAKMEISDIAKRMMIKHPQYNIETLTMIQASTAKCHAIMVSDKPMNEKMRDVSQDLLQIMRKKEGELTSVASLAVSAQAFHAPGVKDKASTVVSDLETLTKLSGWKKNGKDGLKVWLEFKDQEEAASFTQQLQQQGFAKIELKYKTEDKSVPVIMCSDIDLAKLHALAEALELKAKGPVI